MLMMQKKERTQEWTGSWLAAVASLHASLRGDIEVGVGFWRAAFKKEGSAI
jgi:hypothetical protein